MPSRIGNETRTIHQSVSKRSEGGGFGRVVFSRFPFHVIFFLTWFARGYGEGGEGDMYVLFVML